MKIEQRYFLKDELSISRGEIPVAPDNLHDYLKA